MNDVSCNGLPFCGDTDCERGKPHLPCLYGCLCTRDCKKTDMTTGKVLFEKTVKCVPVQTQKAKGTTDA